MRPNPLEAVGDSTQSTLPCRQHDPELFFAESTTTTEYAKSLCHTCPMRLACLRGALERRESWGVWGGEVFVDGQVVAQKRGRGRPPGKAVA